MGTIIRSKKEKDSGTGEENNEVKKVPLFTDSLSNSLEAVSVD